jgi:hypothetical protein
MVAAGTPPPPPPPAGRCCKVFSDLGYSNGLHPLAAETTGFGGWRRVFVLPREDGGHPSVPPFSVVASAAVLLPHHRVRSFASQSR